jgi:UDP-glucose 4-epimerase
MIPANTVLVTGGAGYIGSHTAYALLEAGYRVVVIDDLSTGRREIVPTAATFVEGDVGDARLLQAVLRTHRPSAVLHFAASIFVPESVTDPLRYYHNNTCATRTLLAACIEHGIQQFVFSSTAAVYGEPAVMPIGEDTPQAPINPYGSSKLAAEWMVRDTAHATGLRYVILRYFNVAGADPALRTGEITLHSTHLIKVACEVLVGKRPVLDIFGDDYPTPDGTCMRDYLHVTDLADAHVFALQHLRRGGYNGTFNCGYGHGYSVRDVVDTVNRMTGNLLPWRIAPRRPGDPPQLVADSRRMRQELGWQPRYDDLGTIVGSAFAWEKKLAEMDHTATG